MDEQVTHHTNPQSETNNPPPTNNETINPPPTNNNPPPTNISAQTQPHKHIMHLYPLTLLCTHPSVSHSLHLLNLTEAIT